MELPVTWEQPMLLLGCNFLLKPKYLLFYKAPPRQFQPPKCKLTPSENKFGPGWFFRVLSNSSIIGGEGPKWVCALFPLHDKQMLHPRRTEPWSWNSKQSGLREGFVSSLWHACAHALATQLSHAPPDRFPFLTECPIFVQSFSSNPSGFGCNFFLQLEASCLQLSFFACSCVWELFNLQWEFFTYNWRCYAYNWSLCAYSRKLWVTSTSTNCNQTAQLKL